MVIGQDGLRLLELIWTDEQAPSGIAAVDTLRRIWEQQFRLHGDRLRWRRQDELVPAQEQIASPFDVDARWSYKRSKTWTGYKIHVTETCGAAAPNLILHVETTPATTPDVSDLRDIQTDLQARGLAPEEHIVDSGYMSATGVVQAAAQGIRLIGPPLTDTSWQARTPGAFDLSCFQIDWEQRQVTCPQGHPSRCWSSSTSQHGLPVIEVTFAKSVCQACLERSQCTRGQTRTLKLRPKAAHLALCHAREFQTSPEFKAIYRNRAGVEATIAQAVKGFDLRRTPYRGLDKTHFHHVGIAAAVNLSRAASWLAGNHPIRSRPSKLQSLNALAA